MCNSFNSVPLMYPLSCNDSIQFTRLDNFLIFCMFCCALKSINRNAFKIFYEILLLPLYWLEVCLSVMLHYNTLQCITQHNSGAGSAQLTSTAHQPDPPPAQAWSLLSSEVNTHQGNKNIIFLLMKIL